MAKKYIDADRLKAEIEELEGLEYPCDNSEQNVGFENALDRVSDIITSLQQEQPCEDLEAAEKFVYDWDGLSPTERRIAERAYLAGAERQKEQMIRDCSVQASYEAEIEKAEERGYNLCKEQMMRDAVEGMITCANLNRYILVPKLDESLTYGDKVKIVIVKEDKE